MSVFAGVEVSCDYDAGTFSFSGTTVRAGDFVNALVYRDLENPDIVLRGSSAEDGGYIFNIDPDMETGIYEIAVRVYEKTERGSFAYAAREDIETALQVLNGGADASDIAALFSDEKAKCVMQGLDYDIDGLKDKNRLYGMLAANAPYDGGVNTAMQKIRALGIMQTLYECDSADTARRTVENAAELLKIAQLDAYTLDKKAYVADGYKTRLYNALRKADIRIFSDFADVYRETAILSAAQNLTSRAEIGRLLYDMGEEVSYTEFNSLSESKRVSIGTELLFSEKHTTVADLVKAFNDKVKKVRSDSSSRNNGGTAGGGSSSGGGMAGSGGMQQIMTVESGKNGSTQSGSGGFEDMAGFEWAAAAVERLRKSGIVNGYNEKLFAPGQSVAREEFVKVTVTAFGLGGKAGAELHFEDVNAGDWFYPYIASAYSQGILSGTSKNRFGVGESITREDAAVILFRIMNYKGNLLPVGENGFSDSNMISDYAYDAVSALSAAGYINGNGDGSFAPQKSLSRAEAAQLICNIVWKE